MPNQVKRSASTPLKITGLLGLALASASVQARDLIDVFGISRDAGGTVIREVHVTGSSIPNLVDDAINKSGQFSAFENDRFVTAGIDVLGIKNFLLVTGNDGSLVGQPVTVTLSSAATGLSRTFTGASRDAVQDLIEEFLKAEGTDELAKLMAALDSGSSLSVNSGNPNSSSSLTAAGTFEEYGFTESRTASEIKGEGRADFGIGLIGDVGAIESQGFKAKSYSLPISFALIEKKRWALRAQLPLNYTEIESAKIFRIGLNLALPVMVIGSTKEKKTPWYWQLTPSGGSQATASYDLVAGGVLNNGSLSSALEYNFGPKFHNFSLSLGNQFTMVESLELSISDYKFDPNVSTQIIKNGLKASLPFAEHWVADIYAIDTRLLGNNSALDGYETIGASVGYRRGYRGPYFKVGTYANLAEDYSSAHVQFGTGWKF